MILVKATMVNPINKCSGSWETIKYHIRGRPYTPDTRIILLVSTYVLCRRLSVILSKFVANLTSHSPSLKYCFRQPCPPFQPQKWKLSGVLILPVWVGWESPIPIRKWKVGRFRHFDFQWFRVPPPSYVETTFCIQRGYHLVNTLSYPLA